MAAIRLRGNWRLTLSRYQGSAPNLEPLAEAELEITSATRAGVEGELGSRLITSSTLPL